MYVMGFEDAVKINLTRFSKTNLRDVHVQTVRNKEIVFMPKQRNIDFPLAAHYEDANYTVKGMKRGLERDKRERSLTDMPEAVCHMSCMMTTIQHVRQNKRQHRERKAKSTLQPKETRKSGIFATPMCLESQGQATKKQCSLTIRFPKKREILKKSTDCGIRSIR